ncbi:MAG: hypothetical protein HY291_21865 [Planctomycetes bacterium]|nr:hypothetical protein [Planctomycetota bacterium]
MSHIATVQVRLRDLPILAEVCGHLGVPCDLGAREVKLYSGRVQAAASFQLKDWRYPVAVLADGTVQFDNFNGAWGTRAALDRVLRTYSERVAVRQAQRMGMAVRREEREDGSVVLRLLA